MAAVQQRTLNWLYSVLTSEYQDVNRTYNDAAQALSFYSSLTPRTEVYTYEHGASALLLKIAGTLPVQFRGTTYRFPMAIWIPHAYPREAPMVYVTPAEGMAVRAGQYVDPQGKVYHPYLAGWSGSVEKSNLLDFLAILRDVFAREPPVVARQQQRPPDAASAQRTTSGPPPLPPLPSAQSRSSTLSPTNAPPPPPPKPYSSPPSNHVHDTRQNGPPLPPLPPDVATTTRPPQPPLPPYDNGPYQPQRQSSLRYDQPPALPTSSHMQHGQNTYRPMPQGAIRSPPIGPPLQNMPPMQTYTQDWHASQQHRSHYQQPPPISQVQQQPKAKPPSDLLDGPLTLELPSSTSIPLHVPPVPPNPEKDMLLHGIAGALYAQRQKSSQQTISSIPGLQAQNAAMRNALQGMNHELSNLTALQNTLSSNTSILHSSLQAADATIKSSQGREPPNIDEFLVAPTVVGNQLYELVAEERALGDALFILSRAVERGRVGGKEFVKTTRALAREWFLKKALVRKIGTGMGLEVMKLQ